MHVERTLRALGVLLAGTMRSKSVLSAFEKAPCRMSRRSHTSRKKRHVINVVECPGAARGQIK